MANHKSALKRIRQNEKIRVRNSAARATCRTAVKKTRIAIESGDKEQAATAFKTAEKTLASAATKGCTTRITSRERLADLRSKLLPSHKPLF